MRIPKSFKLAGLTIDVEVDNDLVKKSGCIGQSVYSTQKIIIDTEAAPEETTEQSFLHEVIHWVLFIMGENELRDNEKFVDLVAHLLYQAADTSIYD